MSLTYRETQAQLKALRSNGHKLECALTAKHSVLTAELNRLTSTATVPSQAEATPGVTAQLVAQAMRQAADELDAAKARIAELEAEVQALVAEKHTMLSLLQASAPQTQTVVEPQPELVATDDVSEQVYAELDGYTPTWVIADKLQLTSEQISNAVLKLAIDERIELSALAEPEQTAKDYNTTVENIHTYSYHEAGIVYCYIQRSEECGIEELVKPQA